MTPKYTVVRLFDLKWGLLESRGDEAFNQNIVGVFDSPLYAGFAQNGAEAYWKKSNDELPE